MRRCTLFRAIVLGTLVTAWSCSDPENDSDATTDTIETGSTDSSINTDNDTGTTAPRNTEPDTALGTLAPETAYEGFEELYILTADDDPIDICRVRYELHAVAEPAVPCTICEWDVVVEKRNPTVMVDVNNACENSDLGLDNAAISAHVGDRVAYGFAKESVGHANILMRYNLAAQRWEEYTVSNWDPVFSKFRYKRRDGMCAYAGDGDGEPSTSGICGISGEAAVTTLDDIDER
jgi:hypothetical protein